ncbi:glycosyltransferase family 39 protein [Enterococcus mundtii]|uniref:glycosyltransferase family 39 protein n=1 Tax=Enterococcus mundtii TaxID=53346 RepID=UPI001378011F|nr:phospholipid carrier-dependent glycosyltransferase [Enterococcus mundtii]
MRLNKNIFFQFFGFLVLFFMSWAILTSIFSPRIGMIFSLFRNTYSYKVILPVNILCLIFSILIYFFIIQWLKHKKLPTLKDKFTYIFLSIELLLYFVVLLLFLNYIGFNRPVDDTGIVLNHLKQLQEGMHWGYNYMYSNPQNLLLMYIFTGVQSFFGQNYYAIILIFSIIHLLTIFFIFLSLKKIKISNFVSLLVVQLMIFALQITLHVPVAYTDILSLFFISLSFYFMTRYIQSCKEKTNWVLNLICSLIFCTIGFISKGTVLILVIAIGLFLVISNKKQWKLLGLLPFLFLFIGNFGWKQIINSQSLYPDSNYGQPNTHYLMMGIHNAAIPEGLTAYEKSRWVVGAYSTDEQKFTWKLFLEKKESKSQIEQEHLKIIGKRYSNLSAKQLIEAMNNKVSVTWGSGDLKSSFSVFLGTGKSQKTENLFSSKSTGLLLYSWMMTIQYLLYIGVILSSFYFFHSKNKVVLLCTIYISGYFTFLLFWESSPRYAMGIFIPAVLMIGILLDKFSTRDSHA